MGENYITCKEEKGSINISEDVLVSMVRAAVNEIDGVASLVNNAGAELAGGKVVCPACKTQCDAGAKFCNNCGTPIK